jgi:hypothetical protein
LVRWATNLYESYYLEEFLARQTGVEFDYCSPWSPAAQRLNNSRRGNSAHTVLALPFSTSASNLKDINTVIYIQDIDNFFQQNRKKFLVSRIYMALLFSTSASNLKDINTVIYIQDIDIFFNRTEKNSWYPGYIWRCRSPPAPQI